MQWFFDTPKITTNTQCAKNYVISLRSKELLKSINRITSVDCKLEQFKNHNASLIEVSKKLYEKFDPKAIYCFNNEIHLVYQSNRCSRSYSNCPVDKLLTSACSVASVTASALPASALPASASPVIFTGQAFEFDNQNEILDYIITRQFYCKRNNMTLIYRCLRGKNASVSGVKLDYIFKSILSKFVVPEDIYYGHIIQKQNVTNESGVNRKVFNTQSFCIKLNKSKINLL